MRFTRNLLVKFLPITVLLGAILVACSGPTPTAPQPTQDPATLVAAAVQTLGAQMTAQALRNPSATPVPTNTLTPTETPIPPTSTPGLPTETPTNTATTAPAISAKFLSAGTFPEYKDKYVPNEKFGLAVRYLNTGTMAWQPGYKLKLVGFKGEITVQTDAEIGQAIEPGKPVEFDLWAYGSETLGKHVWYFQLFTPQGVPVPGGSSMFTYTSY
jgi:hypothetical protein